MLTWPLAWNRLPSPSLRCCSALWRKTIDRANATGPCRYPLEQVELKCTATYAMPRPGPATLASLETLFETKRGKVLPLPPNLARLYGCLRMPLPRSHPNFFSNFVTTLDGVVSLNAKGHASGGDISGFSAQDRMVMGLLRAIADVVIIGSGTLGADRRHVWTAGDIFPELADEYRWLSKALGKRGAPLNVIVSGSGGIDLRLPVFASGKVPALIVTTIAGAKRLRKQNAPDSVEIRAIHRSASAIPASAILDEVCRVNPGKLILVEGGPAIAGRLLRGAPCRRAVPDSRAADCRPRRRRPTPQPGYGKGVRAARCPMGDLDQRAARQQPPVSALLVPWIPARPADQPQMTQSPSPDVWMITGRRWNRVERRFSHPLRQPLRPNDLAPRGPISNKSAVTAAPTHTSRQAILARGIRL